MPILEDGVSSGHASDTDDNNSPPVLMKRQVTDVEEELNHSIDKNSQGITTALENGLSPAQTVGVIVVNKCSVYDNVPSQVDPLDEKIPAPPAPVPHRFPVGTNPNKIEAATKDIRLTLQRTKSFPLACHLEEERETNAVSPVWIPRQMGHLAESRDSDRKVESDEEDETDSDLETDGLLGQQHTDDQDFCDDEDWRKPKSRTVIPSHSLSTAKHMFDLDEESIPLVISELPVTNPSSPIAESDESQSPQSQKGSTSSIKPKKL